MVHLKVIGLKSRVLYNVVRSTEFHAGYLSWYVIFGLDLEGIRLHYLGLQFLVFEEFNFEGFGCVLRNRVPDSHEFDIKLAQR